MEADDRAKVLVLTGAGESFSAGMDLKEYFRDIDANGPSHASGRAAPPTSGSTATHVLREADDRHGQRLVLRWRLHPAGRVRSRDRGRGGRLRSLRGELGIPPGSIVSRALAETIPSRDALMYIMTGKTFTGVEAAEMRLVNESVPRDQLRDRTTELARHLARMNRTVLEAAKTGFKRARSMEWEVSEEYLYAKLDQSIANDPDHGRETGMSQFLDEKSFKPGLGTYRHD